MVVLYFIGKGTFLGVWPGLYAALFVFAEYQVFFSILELRFRGFRIAISGVFKGVEGWASGIFGQASGGCESASFCLNIYIQPTGGEKK